MKSITETPSSYNDIIKNSTSSLTADSPVDSGQKTGYPKISVITPSYNQAEFLERTILSVLNQNYPNLEYIIIDGGSSDGSVDIIKQYEKHIHYWVSEQDRGQTHALNKGLKVCSGDLIGWMNSDDIYLPGAFKAVAELAMKHPDYDIYYANKINIGADDKFLRKVVFARPSKGFMKFYCAYRGMVFSNQSAFFRPSVVEHIGSLDENFDIGMDRDYFYRCIIENKRFFYAEDEWGAWRDHDSAKTSSSAKADPRRLKERRDFAAKHGLYQGHGKMILSLLAGVWRRLLLTRNKETGKV